MCVCNDFNSAYKATSISSLLSLSNCTSRSTTNWRFRKKIDECEWQKLRFLSLSYFLSWLTYCSLFYGFQQFGIQGISGYFIFYTIHLFKIIIYSNIRKRFIIYLSLDFNFLFTFLLYFLWFIQISMNTNIISTTSCSVQMYFIMHIWFLIWFSFFFFFFLHKIWICVIKIFISIFNFHFSCKSKSNTM